MLSLRFAYPFLTTVFLSLSIFVFSYEAVVAASNYTVTPMVMNQNLEKRDIVTEKITIENKDSHKLVLFPTVNEVTTNEGGQIQSFVQAVESDRTKTVTSWIELSRAQLELNPGEKREVLLTIHVNPEAAAGEYYAFIGFPEGVNRPEAEQILFDNRALGTVLRISIAKEQSQFLRIEKFNVERFIKGEGEGKVTVDLKNPGKAGVVPKGEIIFYNTSGDEVSSVPFNAERKEVLGEQSTTYSTEVPKDLTLGKYKAFLSVEYGDDLKASLNDTTFFYVIPFRELVIAFAVVLVFSVLLALYIRRRYDREVETFGAHDVQLFVRDGYSEAKDHDIDLKNS